MEKLNWKTTALALAAVGAILSLACAAIIAIWRESALKLLGAMFHGIDMAAIAKIDVSIGSIIAGLVEVVVIGAITGALFAWVYNFLMKELNKNEAHNTKNIGVFKNNKICLCWNK